MTAKKKNTKGEKQIGDHVEDLPVDLSDAELLVHGARLAQISDELQAHYAHEDEVKKSLKANETRLESERMVLSSIVRQKKEPRPVKVEHWANYEAGVYSEIRADTGEVLSGRVRPLAAGEKQEKLLPDTAGAMLSPEAAQAAAEKVVDKRQQRRDAKTKAKDAAEQ